MSRSILSTTISSPDSLTCSINIQPETCLGCSDGSIKISPIGGATPYTFLWNDTQNTTSNILSGLTNTENFSVIISDANNCSKIHANLSLDADIIKNSHIQPKVYPNPSNNIIFIDNQKPFNELLYLRICNVSGKPVYKKKIHKNEQSKQVQTRNWQKGIYILTLSNKMGVCFKKTLVLTD